MSLQAEVRYLRVLACIARGERVAPVDVARELGLELGVTAYYVRKLAGEDLIELAAQTQVRGAIKSWYRVTPEAEVVLREALDVLEREVRETLNALLARLVST